LQAEHDDENRPERADHFSEVHIDDAQPVKQKPGAEGDQDNAPEHAMRVTLSHGVKPPNVRCGFRSCQSAV